MSPVVVLFIVCGSTSQASRPKAPTGPSKREKSVPHEKQFEGEKIMRAFFACGGSVSAARSMLYTLTPSSAFFLSNSPRVRQSVLRFSFTCRVERVALARGPVLNTGTDTGIDGNHTH